MDFKQGIIDAWKIVTFDKKTMQVVAKKPEATSIAVLIIIIAGAALAIGTLNPLLLILGPIFILIGSFISIGIYHIIAKLLGGSATFMEYYRSFGSSYILSWIGAIPFIGIFLLWITGLWQIGVNYSILTTVHRLSSAKAVVTILIPIIIGIIIAAIIFLLVGTAAFIGPQELTGTGFVY